MKTIDELTAAVESAEGAADQMAAIGYLQARLAGAKSY
jgi:hypothetical protein